MKTKKKTILWVCGAVAVLAVAVLVLVLSLPGKEQAGFETETISRGDMENSVTATGTVEPLKQVEVGTQVSGIIDKIYVDYNSEVKEGQIIAELDKNVLEAQLASARLSVESNRNEYEYQQKSYERTKSLYEQGLVSESEYETAEYNYRKAKIAYEQSLTQETQAATDLGYATIYSPIDGVVISKAVEEGQTVASSYSTPTLFTIANDLKKVQVVADVDEADIGSVEEGAEVTFSVDAYPGLVFEGRVNQVRMEASSFHQISNPAGQILWNRGGTLYAASLSLEEETYTNPLFSQTYSSFTALFSYPFAGKDRQGWCAYTASFAPDEWPGSVSILRYQTQALRNLFPYAPLPEQPQVGMLNDLESQSYSTYDFGPTWIGN